MSSITLVLFQNCGEMQAGQANKIFSNPTNEFDDGGSGAFKAGESYDAEKMPYAPQGRLVDDLQDYSSLPGFKALAVASTGFGIGYGSLNFASQSEANQAILEMCEIIAQGSPCALFAEANRIKHSESIFYTKHISVLDVGDRSFAANRIPTLDASTKSSYGGSEYNTWSSSPFKALAVGMGTSGRGSGLSQAEANRRALESCEAVSNEPCTLYAENSTVLFNVNNFNWNYNTRILRFGPRVFVAAEVPFVTDTVRDILVEVSDFVALNKKVVLALSRNGHSWMANDDVDTANVALLKIQALAGCEAQLDDDADHGCMIYSVDNDVVWTADDVKTAQYE